MHMFTIYVFNINTLNIAIHSNIKCMVIAYNQNFHFEIHCKKFHKQDYNSFHHNLILQKITQKMNIKFTVEICAYLYYQKIPKNYSIIPCFVEKNLKQNLKYVLYQNRVYGFLLQVFISPPTFP